MKRMANDIFGEIMPWNVDHLRINVLIELSVCAVSPLVVLSYIKMKRCPRKHVQYLKS